MTQPTAENKYRKSADELIAALRRASDEEGWGITEDDFTRLAATAPEWPMGPNGFLSFRIRFGLGPEGVSQTFEAHTARLNRVFENFSRYDRLRSGAKYLSLFSGDDSHQPGVDWVIIDDLDANWYGGMDADTVRPNGRPLADEGLVIAWLYPDRMLAIKEGCTPGLILAGYIVSHLWNDEAPDETPHTVRVFGDDDDPWNVTRIKLSTANLAHGHQDESIPEYRG